MWPLVTCLQGKLAEVYFRFKKIEDIIHIYEDHMKRLTNWFQSVYAEAVTLTNKFGTEEEQSCFWGQKIIIACTSYTSVSIEQRLQKSI